MKRLVAAALCALSLIGCSDTDDISQMNPAEAWAYTHFNQKFSEDVPIELRRLVRQDLIRAHQRQIDVPADGWFAKIFGGTRAVDVLRYLDDRIHHVYMGSLPDGQNAINASMDYWLLSIKSYPRPFFFEFNGRNVQVRSTRVGILQISDNYARRAPLGRLGTWLHEARHSDCKNGLNGREVARVRDNQLHEDRSCGYLHSGCPQRYVAPDGSVMAHPYAGYPSCDSIPWGAYMINGVYQASLHASCTHCTQAEKQEALMISQDSFLRSPQLTIPMLQGRLGDPDMSSSDYFERVR